MVALKVTVVTILRVGTRVAREGGRQETGFKIIKAVGVYLQVGKKTAARQDTKPPPAPSQRSSVPGGPLSLPVPLGRWDSSILSPRAGSDWRCSGRPPEAKHRTAAARWDQSQVGQDGGRHQGGGGDNNILGTRRKGLGCPPPWTSPFTHL